MYSELDPQFWKHACPLEPLWKGKLQQNISVALHKFYVHLFQKGWGKSERVRERAC